MFVQVSSSQSQSQTVWHTNAQQPQQWNWQHPQQWSHNVHQQHGWYGQQHGYQPSWHPPQQQPLQQHHYQRPPIPPQQLSSQQSNFYHQRPAGHHLQQPDQTRNSHHNPYSHQPLNVNSENVKETPRGSTLVVPRSHSGERVESGKRNDIQSRNPEREVIQQEGYVHQKTSSNNEFEMHKVDMVLQKSRQLIDDLEKKYDLRKADASAGPSLDLQESMEDEEKVEEIKTKTCIPESQATPKREHLVATASPSYLSKLSRENFQTPKSQEIKEDERGFESDSSVEETITIENNKEEKPEDRSEKKQDKDDQTLTCWRSFAFFSKRSIMTRESSFQRSKSSVGDKENRDDRVSTAGKKSIKDKNAAKQKKRCISWNIIKQIVAIILIILDVILDWVEHGEMSNEGEWSSDKSNVSCSSRGDHIAKLFLVCTVLGTLFAIVQIVNLGYQIYSETQTGKEGKKLMDGRTEVVITRLMEEIPQVLLIVAFRSECSIECNSDTSYKDVKSAISATFSICNSVWRHLTSLDGCTFTPEGDKEKSGCCKNCNLQNILWAWFSCCCPCIACLCK
ncbi:hypothetical protein FSP39_000004 [Pinctada imbricata]|uniref:Uncharacterized protein n=1 Tax=Pinctada imbricata TaxID=66713 RepID=A0AA88Y9D9_PINIB|nr:hypothetical protein FSP39_000004 [Pinctada imbricata]